MKAEGFIITIICKNCKSKSVSYNHNMGYEGSVEAYLKCNDCGYTEPIYG